MLKLIDLAVDKELDSEEMSRVVGGWEPMSFLLDGSTRMDNKVAAINSAFGFELDQTNAGAVTNNQAIQGGNGIIYAPVHQDLQQDNYLDISRIGNTRVS